LRTDAGEIDDRGDQGVVVALVLGGVDQTTKPIVSQIRASIRSGR
jgi:hypothetical protein